MFSRKITLALYAWFAVAGTTATAHDALPAVQLLDPAQTIIFVDIGDVVSRRLMPGVQELWKAKSAFWTMFKNKPLTWLYYVKQVVDEPLARLKAEGNLRLHTTIEKAISQCQDNGCGDLTPFKEELLDLACNVYPIMPMISLLEQLKQKGFTLVAATNQNYVDVMRYLEKMKLRGVDLDQLFTAYVTTDETELQDGKFYTTNAFKPDNAYFQYLKKTCKKFNSNATNCVFIDDKKENIDAAENNSIPSAHFALFDTTKSNGFKTSKQLTQKELVTATEQLKNQLTDLGIAL